MTKEIHEKLSLNIRSLGQGSNRKPIKHEAGLLLMPDTFCVYMK